MSPPAQVQHYVPQFLLRNFADEKERIYTYDKKTGKVFRTDVRNVASERGYNDLADQAGRFSIEPDLQPVDNDGASLVRDLLERRSLAGIAPETRARMASFAAVQFQRGQHLRTALSATLEGLREQMRERGFPELIPPPEENAIKALSIAAIYQAASNLAPAFLAKVWFLFEAPEEQPLYIGDNPIALFNQSPPESFYGTLGLTSPGVEIYLPLSPGVSMAFYDPLIPETARAALARWEESAIVDGARSKWARAADLRALVRAADKGEPVPLTAANVERLNSVQVMFATRFVFSRHDNFELVERMIRDNPRYREGLVPTVG